MIKHTHQVTFVKDDYRDTFMFTPDPDNGGTPFEQATARVALERGAAFAHGMTLECKELHSAADTRARGKLQRADRGHFPPRCYYVV